MLDRVWAWLRSGPVSVALAAALVVFFISRAVWAEPALTTGVVAGVGHGWWTLLTYPVWTDTPIHLMVDIAWLVTLGIWLERVMGSFWYATMGFASAWLGAGLSLGSVWLISLFDAAWAEGLRGQYISGITAFLVGAAMAASMKMEVLWRRRVQIGVLVVLGVSVGFSGSVDAISSFVSALVGWGLGTAVWGSKRDQRPLVGTRNEGRVIVALLVAGVAVGSLMALQSEEMIGVLANMRGDLVSQVSESEVAQVCNTAGLEKECAHMSYMLRSSGLGARLLVLMPVLMQLALAWGLRGGRRSAFWGTLALQALTAGIALSHYLVVSTKVQGWEAAAELLGFNESGVPTARIIVPIIVPLALLILVAANDRLFTVKAAAGTYRRYWGGVGVAFAVALAIFTVGGMAERHTFTPEATVGGLMLDYLVRVLPAPALYLVSPHFQSDSRTLAYIGDWLALVPWVAALVLLLMTFRSRALPNAISREQYMKIVENTNAGTMAWMSTWEGNNYWESPTCEGAVAYRSDLGVGLTVTDPAAKPEDLETVMREFADFCADQDLVPAFYSVHPAIAKVTDSWGWPRLQVAEETIIDLPNMTFTGKKFQAVRTALNRGQKEGINAFWTTWEECPAALKEQIVAVSEQWTGEKALPEMGFTLGGIKELDDPPVRILAAVGEDGTLHGATSWMPVYEGGKTVGWTLDFMRRKEDGFRPAMEFMIAQAALWAKEEGYQIVSLSGAPLARASLQGEEEMGSSAQYLDYILEILGKGLEPVYGFRSLLQFKAKFKPRYEPVFLTIPDLAALPQVGLAIGHAYIPDMSARDLVNLAGAVKVTGD